MRYESPPGRESRPASTGAAITKSSVEDTPSVAPATDLPLLARRTEVEQARALLLAALDLLTPRVRCRRCGHPLSAELSVARGIGPECRRREAAVLAVVSR